MLIHDADSVKIFFSLLRSGLYGTPIPASELPDNIDWEAVVALALKHAVFGIIIDSVQYLPDQLRPSAPIFAKMNKFALGLIQANLILDQTAARLTDFLKSHGINGVVLKGQGVSRYYRQPQMRQTGDIDFYVGKKQYKKAAALCRQELSDQKSGHAETYYHFSFEMGRITIELHRLASRTFSPVTNSRFQSWLVEQLEHSPARRKLTVGATDIILPSYDFDAIFIFYHAWRHYISGGIGLRQLCDWAMVFRAHSTDIDTAALVKNIRRFGITKGWKLFAYIAVKYLGLPNEKMPLYDPSYAKSAEKVLADIVDGGNFGYYSKAYLRTRGPIYGLKYGLGKLRTHTEYFITLFPLIPAEATFHFLNRLVYGTADCVKRTIRKR